MERLFDDSFLSTAREYGVVYAMICKADDAKEEATGKGFSSSQLSSFEKMIRRKFQALGPTVTVEKITKAAEELAASKHHFDFALDTNLEPDTQFSSEINPHLWVKNPKKGDKPTPANPAPKNPKKSDNNSIFSFFKF